MVAHIRSLAQRLHAYYLHRVSKEGNKCAYGIGAAAHAGTYHIRHEAGHVHELFPGFYAYYHLKIPDYFGEGMGAQGRADAVNSIVVLLHIALKGRIHSFLQGLKTMGNRNNVCAQYLHAGNVGSLLGNIHLAHVNIALKAKVCGGRGQGHAVLSRACLGNELLFAHILGKETFAHAVVQLVCAGVVKVLTLKVYLALAQLMGKALAVINRGGASLKLLAYAAQLADKLGAVAYGLICVVYFLKGRYKLRRQICPAVSAKASVLCGEFLNVVIVVPVRILVDLHLNYPPEYLKNKNAFAAVFLHRQQGRNKRCATLFPSA